MTAPHLVFWALSLALTSTWAAEPAPMPAPRPACVGGAAACKGPTRAPRFVTLSYTEALRSALQNGLAAETQRLDQILQEAQWESVQAEYSIKPSLSGSSQRPLSGADSSAGTTGSVTAGTSWQLKTGTRLQAQWQQNLNRLPGSTDPRQATAMLELIQPLLKGAGAAARYPLEIARLNDAVATFTRQQAFDNIFTSVSQSFFDAVVAQQQVELTQRSLERVLQTRDMNYSLYQTGRVAQVELLQSDADVSQAELGMARVRNAAMASVNNLLQLLGPEWSERRASSVKVSETLPDISKEEIPTELEPLYEKAEASRTDFRAAQIALDIARIGLARALDDGRPSLDLRLGVSSSNTAPSGGSSTQSTVGVNWVLPIDRTPLRLQRTQARVELQRSELSLKNASRQLRSEVTSALRELEFARAQRVLAAKNTELVRRKLDAELTRFRSGRASGFQLSAAQNELTLAENAELEATLGIQRSLLEFHRANGTLGSRRTAALQNP